MSRKMINVNGHSESWPEGTITPREMRESKLTVTINASSATDIAADVQARMKQFFANDAGAGGFLLIAEMTKEIFFHADFFRYWEIEGRDLSALIKRLESYER